MESNNDSVSAESVSAPPVQKKTVRVNLGITIPTMNVNHTALYKHAEKLPGFKASGFRAMFYTPPARGGKNLQSREHDEVISRAIKAMGLKLQFETRLIKKIEYRFVNIYGTFVDSNEEEETALRQQLAEIVRKFQRTPQAVEIKRLP